MLSYSWVATLLSNFEYWRLFSLIESIIQKSSQTGGIPRKIKSGIVKFPPNHERQIPIPISRHERRSREWLEIGIEICLS